MSEQVSRVRAFSRHIDWFLILPALLLTGIGLLTMHTFGVGYSLAPRQLVWMIIAFAVYISISFIDVRALRRTSLIMVLYWFVLILLVILLVAGHTIMGAKSWFVFGGLSFQPADLAKLVLIALLAKYLSRRHVEIADWRHIVVTGTYSLLIVLLVLMEPDLGTAVIIGSIWFGLMLVSGISKKHLAAIIILLTLAATFLWSFGLKPYQRARIVTFVNPAADIRGAGYNAYQAMIAVGSGELFGKGIGYGTQSQLRFLPEYQTDFIFAAYAEEWGFFGVLLLLSLYGILLARLFIIARHSATNFDAFFTIGVAILFLAHIVVHIGINIGLLPVTGTTIPFMSYGGSHLIMEFAALGVVTSFARFARAAPREMLKDQMSALE
ncbi:MAG TPA: rod shape-determining protein RodA [Candidatus Kaiserbacteria bacterium]|nr:rod shape-determining protein RodA [Candidatus Kaiserbacteria bacterium]